MTTVIIIVQTIFRFLQSFFSAARGWFQSLTTQILALTAQSQREYDDLRATLTTQAASLQEVFNRLSAMQGSFDVQFANLAAELQTIIEAVEIRPVAGVVITFEQEGESNMPQKVLKAALDIQVPDDGSKPSVATLSFVDRVGVPTTPVAGATVATTATMSDPSIVATVSPDGLTITMVPAPAPLPVPLPTGITLSVSVTITNPDGSVIGPLTATGSTALDLVTSAIGGVQIAES